MHPFGCRHPLSCLPTTLALLAALGSGAAAQQAGGDALTDAPGALVLGQHAVTRVLPGTPTSEEPADGNGVPVEYVFEGIGTGDILGDIFTDAAFTLRLTANTGDIQVVSASVSTVIGPTSIDIEGVGSADILVPTRVFVNTLFSAVGLGNAEPLGGLDYVNLVEPEFADYSLDQAIGPIFEDDPQATHQFNQVPTTLGTLNLQDIESVTFEAVLPECFLVFGQGLGAAAFAPAGFAFDTGLADVSAFHAVLMDDIPSFSLPEDIAALGASVGGTPTTVAGPGSVADLAGPDGLFFAQVMMWNPVEVPDAPEQYSGVLACWLDLSGILHARPLETGSIDLSAAVGVDADGAPVVSFPFAIPGF